MKCNFPRLFNGYLCPCGLCMACRINKRRMWTHRLMLESYLHENNGFLTLTYAPEFLPADLSVNPRHLQLYIKRLRKAVSPTKFRFFAVGEYGDKTERPHYHLALFGIGFQHEEAMRKCWQYGHIMLGDLNAQSAGYVCGYVVKKMTASNNHYQKEFLKGRHPEFSRMSRMPGIGVPAIEKILDVLTSPIGINMMAHGDVPYCLRHGGKILPLGRLLRQKLREAYGFKEEVIEAIKARTREEVHAMCMDFIMDSEKDTIYEVKSDEKNLHGFTKQTCFEKTFLSNPQAERNLTAQYGIAKRRKRDFRL